MSITSTADPVRARPPVSPGEILLREFLEPYAITPYRLARELGVTPMRISEILNNERSITVDTAKRLARFFGNSAQFWMNLQSRYDLEVDTENSLAIETIRPFEWPAESESETT
jgi:addiction module HigA family antidote